MQTLTVKNIEEKHTKDGSKSFFIITDTTGASFSLWEPIGMIKPGCVLEADIEVKGKYTNIKNFTIKSQPDNLTPTQTSGGRPAYGQDSPEKRRSMALSYAKDLRVADKIPDTGFWKVVFEFDTYISQGAIPPDKPTSTPTASQPVAQKQAAGSGQPSKTDTDLFGDAPAFKDGVELFNYALKHNYTLAQLKTTLHVAGPNDIKDVEAARKVLGL